GAGKVRETGWHGASVDAQCRRAAGPRLGCKRRGSSLRLEPMTIAATLQRLHSSFSASAGSIVFGMEDGTVSIFGLIFGVGATTSDAKTVLIAGATGAVAAAVSMMAGAYLDVETTRDAANAARAAVQSAASSVTSLAGRLTQAGLTPAQS